MSSSGRVKAGAWIDAITGTYAWIDGLAHWVDLDAALACLRLPPETVRALGQVPWDLTANAHPEALTEALVQGMIRVRLGDSATFETTIPVEVAVKGAFRFMSENLDPRCLCRFNNLNHAGQSCGFRWDKARAPLRKGDLTFLTPRPLRAPTHPPVPAPWLLLDLGAPGHGLSIYRLDPELIIPVLLKVVRPHVGPAGGWLGLPDGRRWRMETGMPPLVRVGKGGRFMGFEVCPDCGWPHQGEVAPCKCWMRAMCKVCTLPIHWPPPVHETITLRGEVLHMPHMAAYAHQCINWPSVKIMNLITK
jgi:hypothetical protein